MSRLIDKLKQVSNNAPQPIGFRSAKAAAPKLQMILIASLTHEGNTEIPTEYITGADAVLIPATKSISEARLWQKEMQSLPDIPRGEWIEDTKRQEIATLVKNGCDFLVFPASSKVLTIPENEKIGKVLQVASSLDEGLLRTVGQLPVDAVLVIAEDGEERFLTWHQLMLLQRLAALSTKPMLVSAPPDTTIDELKALWEAGVDGVVIEVSSRQPKERIGELRQAIEEFDSHPPHRRGKKEALLPYISEEAEVAAELEEEDDE